MLRDRARAPSPARIRVELLAEWHAERSAGDPRLGDAADALVAVAIVLREIADAFELELQEAA